MGWPWLYTLELFKRFLSTGVGVVSCVSLNHAKVMAAWHSSWFLKIFDLRTTILRSLMKCPERLMCSACVSFWNWLVDFWTGCGLWNSPVNSGIDMNQCLVILLCSNCPIWPKQTAIDDGASGILRLKAGSCSGLMVSDTGWWRYGHYIVSQWCPQNKFAWQRNQGWVWWNMLKF